MSKPWLKDYEHFFIYAQKLIAFSQEIVVCEQLLQAEIKHGFWCGGD